jgi:hypothetical protein
MEWKPWYPRFVPKRCEDGAHHMHRSVDGARVWVCEHCGKRREFNLPAFPHPRADT